MTPGTQPRRRAFVPSEEERIRCICEEVEAALRAFLTGQTEEVYWGRCFDAPGGGIVGVTIGRIQGDDSK